MLIVLLLLHAGNLWPSNVEVWAHHTDGRRCRDRSGRLRKQGAIDDFVEKSWRCPAVLRLNLAGANTDMKQDRSPFCLLDR